MENNTTENYINIIKTYIKKTYKNIRNDFDINLDEILKLSSKYFELEYIIDLLPKNIGKLLSQKDRLNIFLCFINLKKKCIYTKCKNSEHVNNFIETMIDDPYDTNKQYKLKLSIEKLDEIYKNINGILDYNNEKRIKYALKKIFKSQYMSLISIRNLLFERYKINEINLETELHIHTNNEYATLKEYYEREKYICNFLIELNEIELNYKILNQITPDDILDENQRLAFNTCIENNFSIITGGPGTGKSTIIGELLKVMPSSIVLAPTGCAVNVIQKKFPMFKQNCMTLHSFYYTMSDINLFISKNKCIIFDEMSMVDIFILFKILNKIKMNMNELKIIMIGDYNQLPSIKQGNILFDLIKSNKFNVYNLEKCYRSDKDIINVLDYLMKNKILTKSNKLKIIKYENPLDLYPIIENDLYSYFHNEEKTILSPTNKVVNEINNIIQEKNPNKIIYEDNYSKFKKNDKIIFLKNEKEFGLYNGSILYIESIDYENSMLKIIFTNKQIFECDSEDLSSYIKLAYAMTIHKSQGNEFETVFIIMTVYPKIMWDIKLIFTAISRAKKNVFLCGNYNTIQSSCKIQKQKITSFDEIICHHFGK